MEGKKSIKRQLEDCTSDISNILRLSGSPGLSIGAFNHGRIIHTEHFGFRDSNHGAPPNDHSIYYIASLSKLVAVSAIGTLVQDGLLHWDDEIRHHLPQLQGRKDDFGTKGTIRDLASNRTVTGKPFGQIMKEKILDPLGMNDSSFEIPKGGNVMTPHAVRNDGTVFRNIPVDTFDSEKGLSAVMGGKISLHDILKMYSDMLRAYRHQKHNSTDTTPGSPFVQLREIFNKHIPLTKEISCSQHYCLGTYRTSLPGNLSYASYNAFLLQNKTPVFEDSRPGTIVYHHTGNKAGYFSSMFLVPETQSGVVCFTNATPLMDPTDLCSQIYLSVLLGSKSKVDHISLAKTAAAAQLKMYNGTSSYIQRKKTDIPPTLPLSSYAGTYINDAQNFSLIVRVNRSTTGLQVSIQNSLLTTYDLLPWDRDTFYWEVDWEREICEKGMFPVPIPVMHLRSFGVAGKAAESLKWRHEMLVKDPEVFQRVDSKEKGEL